MRALTVPVALLLCFPSPARAEFAEPPPGEVAVAASDEPFGEPWSPHRTRKGSSVRAHVGPAFDVARGDAGFHLALDVGKTAGFRAATSFVALGSDGGSAIYSGELWLCPADFGLVRPIVAAGAGYRDVSRDDGQATFHERAGVAVLRGGVEFLFPTRDVETRAAVSLAGYLPAIVSRNVEKPETSALLTASLALGF